jgi:hypothetical protein
MKKFIIKLNKSLLIRVVLFSVVFLHNYIFEVNAATINAMRLFLLGRVRGIQEFPYLMTRRLSCRAQAWI